MTGHQEELTCTFQDGSQKVFANEEVALKGIAASFTAAGICGGCRAVAFDDRRGDSRGEAGETHANRRFDRDCR